MSGPGISGFRLRIGRLSVLAGLLVLSSAPAARGAAKPTPTPTPTARPRKLAGGFGRGAADAGVTPVVAVTPVPADSQSLADAVRAARKKKASGAPAVSITNKTLVTDPKKGRLSTASPRPVTPPVPASEEVTPTTPAPAQEREAEAYWRERMHSARARVEEMQERVHQFEFESKKLENDFYSWDDGQYRDGVIKPAWDKKREELVTAGKELEQAEKELSELPEKARKAGALPGWLRE